MTLQDLLDLAQYIKHPENVSLYAKGHAESFTEAVLLYSDYTLTATDDGLILVLEY